MAHLGYNFCVSYVILNMQLTPQIRAHKTKDLFGYILANVQSLAHLGLRIYIICPKRSEAAHPPTRNGPPRCIPDYSAWTPEIWVGGRCAPLEHAHPTGSA